MKYKIVTLILALSLVGTMTACGANKNVTDTYSEYVFTLIESGGNWGGSLMQSDLVCQDIVYISAIDQRTRKTYFNKLDISDASVAKLTVDHLFDSDFTMYEIFPLTDGGCYIFARSSTEDRQILKRFSADFEPMYELDLLKYVELSFHEVLQYERHEYTVCGVTDNGDAVIWTPEEVFTIAPDDEKKDTWEYANIRGHRTFTKALVSGNDILRCEYNITLDIIYLSWLRAGGIIEPYAEIDSIYSTVMLDKGVVYIADDSEQTLYSLSNKGEMRYLLNYSDGKSNRNFHEIIALLDGSFIAYISRDYYIIHKGSGDVEKTKADGRNTITIATYGQTSLIREQVYNFNQESAAFTIEIVDYSEFEDGVAKLNVEFIAGTAPDLIYWDYGIAGNLNPEVYSRAGVLLDLYALIDDSDDISRDSLLQNLLVAIEGINGELFEMPLCFILQLVAGSTEVVGSVPGWTFEDYFRLLERHPEATLPFGNPSWSSFLWYALSSNYEAFISWEKGEAYFDSNEFIGLLQIAKGYYLNSAEAHILEVKNIQAGKQLLISNALSDVSSIQRFNALFGTEVNFIGFPTTSGVGNSFVLYGSISINSASDYIDGCWEFIKTLLSYEEQLNQTVGFPVNYEALNERLDNSAKYEEAGVTTGTIDSMGDMWSVTYTDATSEEIATVRRLIVSIDRVFRNNSDIMTIIEEVAPSYFSGDRTLEDTVRIIQSRIQIYVSEQSW